MNLTAEEKGWMKILQERPDIRQLLRTVKNLDAVELKATLVCMEAFRLGADEITALREMIAYLMDNDHEEKAQKLIKNCLEPMTGAA